MNFRITSLAFISSLALHGAGGILLGAGGWPLIRPPQEPVIISYVQAVPETQRRRPQPVVRVAQPPLKQYDVETAAIPRALPPVAQVHSNQLKVRHQRLRAIRPFKAQSVPKTGADFLTDPQRGKVFVNYFGNVKEKLHKTIKRKIAHRQTARGNVALLFVLDAEGRLVKSSVIDKESSAGDALKTFALQCLGSAAPFGSFPKSLGNSEISFTVNVFFDEI